MKKLIITLIALFAIVAIQAQSATVIPQKQTALTLQGVDTETVTFTPSVLGEYDVSLQLIPALSLSGDSLDFSFIVYQSNSIADAVWTAITTTATVSSVTDADAIVAITDFDGLRLKAICIGISTDTSTVQAYMVAKKHKEE